ncbi:MAG: ATP synthase F1 subunit epsilon [Actinomycetota bacterium]
MPLEVRLVTPEREVWAGPAEMLIARGVEGEVGILAGHAPLLVRLAIGPMRIVREGDDAIVAAVDGGFLHVGTHGDATRADVLASYADLRTEIDAEAARQRVTELEGRLQDLDTQTAEAEILAARAELQKALVRVNLAG